MKIFSIVADVTNADEDITLNNKFGLTHFVEAEDALDAIKSLMLFYTPKNEQDNWYITISTVQVLNNPPIFILKPHKFLGRDIEWVEKLDSDDNIEQTDEKSSEVPETPWND